MTISEKVKLALRISHNLLDEEIADVIASAGQELVRAGVDSDLIQDPTELVESAIVTYVKAYYVTGSEADRYMESFKYQCDNLRKSTFSTEGDDNV